MTDHLVWAHMYSRSSFPISHFLLRFTLSEYQPPIQLAHRAGLMHRTKATGGCCQRNVGYVVSSSLGSSGAGFPIRRESRRVE